jgi:hypothetical protein
MIENTEKKRAGVQANTPSSVINEADYDLAHRKHLQKIGCSKRTIPRIINLWGEKVRRAEHPEGLSLILDYSGEYLAKKGARNPGRFIIAELEDHLGIRQRQPPKPKPPRQLTPEQLANKQLWAEHNAVERAAVALCVDTSFKPPAV